MVVMTPAAAAAEIAAVVERLEAAGVHAKVMPGELTTAIGAIGDPEGVRALALEGMAGVDQVIPISRPYKLASSELSHDFPTSFEVDGRRVGGREQFTLIAGPCTVESPEQTLAGRGGARARAPEAPAAPPPAAGPRAPPPAGGGGGGRGRAARPPPRPPRRPPRGGGGRPPAGGGAAGRRGGGRGGARGGGRAPAPASVCSRDSTVHG